jgi:hypothetical protein
MSRRVTISIPDDVAAQLDELPPRQVSAYVTEALRRRRASDEVRAVLREAGHGEFAYDPDASARRLAATRVEPAVREAAIARLAESMRRPVDEVRAQLDARVAE